MRSMYRLAIVFFLLNIFFISNSMASGNGQLMPFSDDLNPVPFSPKFEVNPDYVYEPDDIRKILELKVGEFHPEVQLIISSDISTEVEKYLENGILTKDLLIACNTVGVQWVGIYARRIKRGKNVALFYIDPEGLLIHSKVDQFVEKYFNQDGIQVVKGLQQHCEEDSGVLTIENLMNAHSGLVAPGFITDSRFLRNSHLETMQNFGNLNFCERQYLGWPTFSYDWEIDGLKGKSRTCVLPFNQCIAKEDIDKITATFEKLRSMEAANKALLAGSSIMKLPGKCSIGISRERDIYGNFSGLLSDIDGSSSSPLGFALQLKYKQVPWHLLQLHWWQSACPQPIKEVIFKEFSEIQDGRSGLESISTMFKKIQTQEPLDKADLMGVTILTPYWETGYIKAVLEDTTRRLNGILPEDLEVVDFPLVNQLAVLRFMQCTGEYFKKLESIDFFFQLSQRLDCSGFRNVLSHLSHPKSTFEALQAKSFKWAGLLKDLDKLRTQLILYKQKWDLIKLEEAEDMPMAKVVWENIKTFRAEKTNMGTLAFESIKQLRAELSEIQGKKAGKIFSFSSKDMRQIVPNLAPYSRDEERELVAFDEQNLLTEKRKALKSAFFLSVSKKDKKGKTPDEVEVLKQDKNQERKDRVEALVKELEEITESHHTKIGQLLADIDQDKRDIKKIDTLIGEVIPFEKKELSEEAKQVIERRHTVGKSLSKVSIDPRAQLSLQEYMNFVTNVLHKKAVVRLSEEFFWQDIPSYPEVMFYRLQSKSLPSPANKLQYRILLMEEAVDTVEWFREAIGVSSIDLAKEAQAPNSGLSEICREDILETVSEVEVHFNSAPCLLTTEKTRAFLEENRDGEAVLEFFVALVYESMKPIFYFPEFKSHFLHNMKVRNYYDHPDSTRRTPLVIWETVVLNKGWDGRTIRLRPDRGEGYLEVLTEESSKICVALHHVLSVKLQAMKGGGGAK